MLATLLAMKDDDEIRLSEMYLLASDGVKATETVKKKLKNSGYLKVTNENGKWFFEINEQPLK
jgi:hypothetical protein